MKELEKSFQDAFENFEPEVSQDVWLKLEQNLNTAGTTGGSQAGTGAKVASAVKSSTIAWVTGAVITGAVVTASLLMTNKSAEKSPVVVQEKSPVATEITANEQNNAGQNAEETTALPSTSEIKKQASSADPVSITGPVIQDRTAEMQNTPGSPENSEHSSAADHTDNKGSDNTVNTTTVKEEPVHPAVVSTNSPAKPETAATEVPLQVIINHTCGFAPFKVAAVLNNETATGNWNFGDGYATQKSNTASHTYNRPGVYELVCESGDLKMVKTIEVIGTLQTVLTPNGDGQNDEFFIDHPDLQVLKVKIFNRYGGLVYEITAPGERWNGKDEKGNDLLSGTYFYDIFARSNNGQTINQKGTINLFR